MCSFFESEKRSSIQLSETSISQGIFVVIRLTASIASSPRPYVTHVTAFSVAVVSEEEGATLETWDSARTERGGAVVAWRVYVNTCEQQNNYTTTKYCKLR